MNTHPDTITPPPLPGYRRLRPGERRQEGDIYKSGRPVCAHTFGWVSGENEDVFRPSALLLTPTQSALFAACLGFVLSWTNDGEDRANALSLSVARPLGDTSDEALGRLMLDLLSQTKP